MNDTNKTHYYLQIVEQPAKEARFRYLREARTTSSIVGENSDKSNKTFPTITTNYRGSVRVITVLVDKDCRPHPHGLVGPNCKNGICVFETDITDEKCNIVFRQSIGIQCAKKPDVLDAMLARQKELYGDPFRRGYDHSTHDSIDLHEVRLAFVALIADASGRLRLPLMPVASNVIRDTKASMHLRIVHTSDCRGPATGGSKITLLTETVSQMSTVKMMFYEQSTGWFGYADNLITHKRVAFIATVPPYYKKDITKSVFVECFLIREHERGNLFDPAVDRSEPLRFEYYPAWTETVMPPLNISMKGLSCDSKELKILEEAYLKPRQNEDTELLSLKMQRATVEPPPYQMQPHSSVVPPPLIEQSYHIHPHLVRQSYQMLPHTSRIKQPSINGGCPTVQSYQEQPPSIGQPYQKRLYQSTVQPPSIDGDSTIVHSVREQTSSIGQPYQKRPYLSKVQPPSIDGGFTTVQSIPEQPPSEGQPYQKRPYLSTVQPPLVGQSYQLLPQPTIEQSQETLTLQHLLLKRKKSFK